MRHDYRETVDDVVLRPLAQGDIEQIRVWRNDAGNSKYISHIRYITEEMQRNWYASYLEDASIMTFAVECSSQLVGTASLYDFKEGHAEFGKIMIGASGMKGRGLGYKASLACLRIGFNQMGLERIDAEVSVDNTAALIIYVRLGFCITGRRFSERAEQDEFTISVGKSRFRQLNM